MSAAVDTETLSAECAVARRPGYEHLHASCTQTEDIMLPHSNGLVLVPRCRCPHHQAPS